MINTIIHSTDKFSLDELCIIYIQTLNSLFDKHAARTSKTRRILRLSPWFDDTCYAEKRRACRLKR